MLGGERADRRRERGSRPRQTARSSTGAASQRPTTTTTATSTSRSARSPAGSSCYGTRAPRGTGSRCSSAPFAPGAEVTAVLPGGRRLVREVQAGGELPLVGGSARCTSASATRPRVRALIVRYPDGRERASPACAPTASSPSSAKAAFRGGARPVVRSCALASPEEGLLMRLRLSLLSFLVLALASGSSPPGPGRAGCDPMQTPPSFRGEVPTAEQVLGFPLGSREVTAGRVERLRRCRRRGQRRGSSAARSARLAGPPDPLRAGRHARERHARTGLAADPGGGAHAAGSRPPATSRRRGSPRRARPSCGSWATCTAARRAPPTPSSGCSTSSPTATTARRGRSSTTRSSGSSRRRTRTAARPTRARTPTGST